MSKSQPVTQTTTSQSSAAPWLQSAEQGLLGSAMGLQAPGPYTGEGVAPLTPAQMQALGLSINNVGSAQPILAPGVAAAGGVAGMSAPQITAGGINADTQSLLDPYTNTAVASTNQQINQQRQLQQNQSDAQLAADGAFGSDRNAVATALNNQVYDQTLANTDAGMYNTQFNGAQNTAAAIANANQNSKLQSAGLNLSGAGTLGNLAGTLSGLNTNDINGLLTTGGTQQQTQQAGDTFNYQQFLAPWLQQMQQLGLSGSLAGAFAPGNTDTTGTKTGQVYSSPLTGLLGLTLGGLSLASGNPMGIMGLLNGANSLSSGGVDPGALA